MREAEEGLLLARYLFPHNRLLYGSQMEASIQCGLQLFDRGEKGHPANVGRKLREYLLAGPYQNSCTPPFPRRRKMQATMIPYKASRSQALVATTGTWTTRECLSGDFAPVRPRPAQADENLYRYCENMPTQATDPSGLLTVHFVP